MTSALQISQGRSFYAPRFEIVIDGQAFEPYAVRDVLDVTYCDSLNELAYFEFTLNDWDPVRVAPKYSSPFDETGAPIQDGAGGTITPIEPGMNAELSLGYYDPEDTVPKMAGTIVSITPGFPDSGMPQMKVRVLSNLFQLQKKQITRTFENQTDTDIATTLTEEFGLGLAVPNGQGAGEVPVELLQMNNEFPILFLKRRARVLGYDIGILPRTAETTGMTVTGSVSDGNVMYFGPADPDQPVYALHWGKTLSSFNIAVRIKDQVASVEVTATNPQLAEGEQTLTGTATLADLDLDLPDPRLLDTVTQALADTVEQVVGEPVQSQAEADARALGILRERVKDMITAEGGTIGFPDLRAGRVIEVTGIGARYSGHWVLTKTTHKIDSAGYLTTFSCRLVGSLP